MPTTILELLQIMVQYNASDLIIKHGVSPIFRINKELAKGEMEALDNDTLKEYLKVICNEENYIKVINKKEEAEQPNARCTMIRPAHRITSKSYFLSGLSFFESVFL